MTMRLLSAAALALTGAGLLGGCASSQPSRACFREKPVVLPDPERVRPSLSTGEGGRALYDAVVAGDREGARALLRADPGLAATAVPEATYPNANPDGQYGDLLTFAVAACDPAMVATLLGAGLAPDGADPGQPLSVALLADDLAMAEMLLAAGASPDPQKGGGRNAFYVVGAFGDPEPVRLLIRHGLDLGWVDRFGRGHLDSAVSMEVFEVAEALIEAGDSPWEIADAGVMPVHGIMGPAILAQGAQAAAQDRLRALMPRPGLPWPPPDPATVRARVLSGEWPTPQMQAAGMTISPEALARTREVAPRLP